MGDKGTSWNSNSLHPWDRFERVNQPSSRQRTDRGFEWEDDDNPCLEQEKVIS